MATRIADMQAFFRVPLVALTALVAYATEAVAQPAREPAESTALQFVRAFYAWYVPAQARSHERGVEFALKQRGATLGDELRRALVQDTVAQARAKGEIDGLDFDPFLNSQDPCDSYVARRVRRDGAGFAVEVYGTCRVAKDARPDVVVEVAPRGNSWVIQNFRYSDKNDLLGLLRRLHGAPKRSSSSGHLTNR
jgi:hypothetical protein